MLHSKSQFAIENTHTHTHTHTPVHKQTNKTNQKQQQNKLTLLLKWEKALVKMLTLNTIGWFGIWYKAALTLGKIMSE